jgi:hypothetical protein
MKIMAKDTVTTHTWSVHENKKLFTTQTKNLPGLFVKSIKIYTPRQVWDIPLTLMGLLASCTIDWPIVPPSKQAEKHRPKIFL